MSVKGNHLSLENTEWSCLGFHPRLTILTDLARAERSVRKHQARAEEFATGVERWRMWFVMHGRGLGKAELTCLIHIWMLSELTQTRKTINCERNGQQ